MATDPSSSEETQYEEKKETEVDNTVDSDQNTRQMSDEEFDEQNKNQVKMELDRDNGESNGAFVHGLSVGLGIGCIATFAIMWFVIFFTPLVPSAMTYENLLAIFIYPLIYLLVVGLVALTAGVVRHYYTTKTKA